MSVFSLCEQAIGLVRGRRLILSDTEKTYLEALNYEGLTAAHAQDEAVVCALHFARVRDRLLELHAWKFARKTATVKAGANLPSDCVSVLCVCVNGRPVDYVQTGSTLNVGGTVYYTAKITDTSKWSGAFNDVFCYSLAEEICPAVTGEPQYTQLLEAKVQEQLRRAYQTGAIQPETRLTETQELYHRAIVLSRGTRSVSGSGNASSEQGLDIQGALNWRTQAEMNACETGAPIVRDRLLEGYAWRFARRTATLTKLSETVSGWSCAYSLPADCMKVLSVMKGNEAEEYEEADGKIYANTEGLTARFTAKVQDIASWSGMFKDVFTYQLAVEIVYATTGNAEIIKLLEEKARILLSDALANGEIQGESSGSLGDDLYGRAIELAHGDEEIDALKRARELSVCRRNAGYVRDRLLQEYPWSFARKHVELTGTGSGVHGWAYRVDVPADCVKVLAVVADGEAVDFEDCGSCVYVNAKVSSIMYSASVTDMSKWPGLFADVFCYELAQEILISTGSRIETLQVLRAKSAEMIREAERYGLIRAEANIPLSVELYQRALTLIAGTRTLKGTSERALSEGSDHTGDANTREVSGVSACRLAAPKVRDRILQLYPWVFARKSSELKKAGNISGWNYGYELPSDCLTVLTVLSNGEAEDWEEAGGKIYTNGSNAVMRYTARIEDMQLWPGAFCDAFVYALAVEVAMSTVGAVEIIAVLEQKLAAIIQDGWKMGAIRQEVRIPVKQELYNRAIGLVKGLKTGSIDVIDRRYEDEISACRRAFESIRNRLLEVHPWRFARKSKDLEACIPAVKGWRYGYELPSDCLAVLAVIAETDDEHRTSSLKGERVEPVEWEVSGKQLYANHEPVTIRYTSGAVKEAEYPASFNEALVYELACEILRSTQMSEEGTSKALESLKQQAMKVIDDSEQTGQIKAEQQIPVRYKLCRRALGLVRGLMKQNGTVYRGEEELTACLRNFNMVRDRILQLYPWVFARRTTEPQKIGENLSGWRYKYRLPKDCLKVVAVVSGEAELIEYEVTGNEIYTDSSCVSVRYTALVADTHDWAAAFTDALCVMLAREIAMASSMETGILKVLDAQFEQIIQTATESGIIKEETGLLKRHKTPRQLQESRRYLDYSGIPTMMRCCYEGRTSELFRW